jgi:serine/threonine-protein kinase
MELLEGESLSARIKRTQRLPVAAAADFAFQTAGALAAAHAARIVHRDLKPDNIFLVPDLDQEGREVIKILDFGIAKLNAEGMGAGGVKTRTGAVLGTPVYMSPEQCLGNKEVDHRSDIYSLGIILYEMICGRPPFVSSGYGELIHMHLIQPPAPPRKHAPGLPAELEAVMLKLLAKDPGQRYQSMGEVQQALRTIRGDLVTAPPPGAGADSSPGPRSDPSLQTTFSTAASTIEGASPAGRRAGRTAVVAALLIAGGVAVAVKTAGPLDAPAAPVAEPVAPPSPSAPAPPASISLNITSTPPGARLVRERDGANIGATPFKDTWPREVGAEKLRLELDGYRPEPFAVPLERGVDLTFSLTPLPPAPRPRQKTPASRHRPGPAPAPKPEPNSEPLPL